MEKQKAADLSTQMAEAHVAERDEEIGDELYKGVDGAIFSYLHLLPDEATTAILRQDGEAILAALSGNQLYLLTVDGQPGSRNVQVNCEPHCIRPGHDKVTMAARFPGVPGPNAIREATWRFTFDSRSLEIQTRVHPEHGELPKSEALAQALAKQMGCPLTTSSVEPLVAVL